MENIENFFITTNGHTASKWLAKVISLHPKIICSHGAAELSISTIHNREYTEQEKIKQMTQEFRKQMPVNEILKELKEWDGEASVIGNVHLFNLRHLDENLKRFEFSGKLNIVDIVRHPVSFVQSGFHNILSQCRFNPERINYVLNVKNKNLDFYRKYGAKFCLDLNNLEVLSFMANIMTLKSFEINFNLKNYTNRFRMEDVTSSKDIFIKLIQLISGNSIEIDIEYINKVMDSEKANNHDPNSSRIGEKVKYEKWEKWQQEMFVEVLYLTNGKQNFENLDYDLTFL